MEARTFAQLKKNLKKTVLDAKPVRVALLGDSSTQLLAQALRATGVDFGLDLRMWESDFDQVQRQALDPGSELYSFEPDRRLFLSTLNCGPNSAGPPEAKCASRLRRWSHRPAARCRARPARRESRRLTPGSTMRSRQRQQIEESFLYQQRSLRPDGSPRARRRSTSATSRAVQNRVGRRNCFKRRST
jgi:hypothetical protein